VSRAVARLEAHLGAPLFVRDQRALRLTEAGLEYRAFAAAAAAALDEGERAVEASSGTIRGTLRVSAPRALGEVCVAEMLGAFLDRHPQVSVELALSDDLVRFSTENVDVAIRAAHDGFEVSVRDRGPGVPPEFVPRLFDKFSQADGDDARRSQGTGLGLSIAHEIVAQHDGELRYAGAEDGGATFTIWLPRRR